MCHRHTTIFAACRHTVSSAEVECPIRTIYPALCRPTFSGSTIAIDCPACVLKKRESGVVLSEPTTDRPSRVRPSDVNLTHAGKRHSTVTTQRAETTTLYGPASTVASAALTAGPRSRPPTTTDGATSTAQPHTSWTLFTAASTDKRQPAQLRGRNQAQQPQNRPLHPTQQPLGRENHRQARSAATRATQQPPPRSNPPLPPILKKPPSPVPKPNPKPESHGGGLLSTILPWRSWDNRPRTTLPRPFSPPDSLKSMPLRQDYEAMEAAALYEERVRQHQEKVEEAATTLSAAGYSFKASVVSGGAGLNGGMGVPVVKVPQSVLCPNNNNNNNNNNIDICKLPHANGGQPKSMTPQPQPKAPSVGATKSTCTYESRTTTNTKTYRESRYTPRYARPTKAQASKKVDPRPASRRRGSREARPRSAPCPSGDNGIDTKMVVAAGNAAQRRRGNNGSVGRRRRRQPSV